MTLFIAYNQYVTCVSQVGCVIRTMVGMTRPTELLLP
jgi:hypothetical protein